MPVLKKIDVDFNCPVLVEVPDDIFKNFLEYNNLRYIVTDIAGSQSTNLDPYEYFAINRILSLSPIENNSPNRWKEINYNCLLTIAKPANPSLEVENVDSSDGQHETIVKELLTLEFLNTFKSYFTCCNFKIVNVRVTPIYNSNSAAKGLNHTGIEINLTVTI